MAVDLRRWRIQQNHEVHVTGEQADIHERRFGKIILQIDRDYIALAGRLYIAYIYIYTAVKKEGILKFT